MDPGGILEALVSIPSVTGEEESVAQYIAGLLDGEGVSVEVMEVEPGRPNLLARVPGEGEPLLFMGHLDTVPPGSGWDGDPFKPRWEWTRMVGLGSCDMKGGVASIILALASLAGSPRHRETWGLFTVGEEVNSLGAYRAVDEWLLGKKFHLLVVPEPTAMKMGVAEKGVLWLRLTLEGEGGHASMAQGPRALEDGCRLALEVVEGVRKTSPFHPLLGSSTAEITSFHGGWKTNVMPPRATLEMDVRLVPGMEPSRLVSMVEVMARGKESRVQVEIINNRPPVESRGGLPLEEFARAAEEVMGGKVERVGLPYYSDVSAVVPRVDVPFVLFGPGDPRMAHTPREWVDVVEVEKVARVLERAALL